MAKNYQRGRRGATPEPRGAACRHRWESYSVKWDRCVKCLRFRPPLPPEHMLCESCGHADQIGGDGVNCERCGSTNTLGVGWVGMFESYGPCQCPGCRALRG
jgi:hypothetical protein